MIGKRARSWREVLDFDVLAFEFLVILKEPHEHRQAVRRHFVGFLKSTELRIVQRHGQDLVVLRLPLSSMVIMPIARACTSVSGASGS